MRLFVTGATGGPGSVTVPALLAAGHEVRGVARSERKAAQLRTQGAEPVSADLFDRTSVGAAVEGCDGVVHLAASFPPLRRMTDQKAWRTHDRLMSEATRVLVDAAVAEGASVFLKKSTADMYRDAGARWIDEDHALVGGVFKPTIAGERIATSFSESGGRGIVLRLGFLYGPQTRALRDALRMAKEGVSPVAMGDLDGYIASLHVEDTAPAIVAALERAPAGVYNVCDEPVTKREYLEAFAAAFRLKRVPAPQDPSLLLLMGFKEAPSQGASERVSNARFRAATGWEPRYPSVIEGWPAVAAAHRLAAEHR